ncbi:TatD family hydrolase [Fulvivirga kasyanovii]|jgi:TatD DNase family protein|uniref:TatD family deoxyribonuclease n=1 Tax=Fulvivirga kasyanovii TaxID=396812 RepID=A0ABW9RV86_9BACT|nr:Qat anti-phage system TatD family nuclease QatD [Fulvivirga kasyanovii]MBT31789.1 hydrolase TatD [Thalassovita sp.]MTI27816.1 TatD family deoxyribonuclease [Fulvivirga kasyanovii]HNP17028.1 TatD family hydrolase [Fulvivirga sp.]
MNLIDTHFHLDLINDPISILEKIEKQKIYTIAVTNTPSVFHYTKKITENKKYVRPAIGLHPELAEQRIRELSLFKHLIHETRYIGEVGLDNIKKCSSASRDAQLKVFDEVVKLAQEAGNKILTIHSRGSEAEVIDRIGEKFPGKVILHWYSGSLQNLDRAISSGFYFSINSAMCRSKNGQKIIKHIPIIRLLTESDGPFIKLNNNDNSPLYIQSTIENIASILGLEKIELAKTIYKNFKIALNSPLKI